jgi:hypothetical protein
LHISVHNPEHVSSNVVRLEVDGIPVQGNLVLMDGLTGEHQVEIWMGK